MVTKKTVLGRGLGALIENNDDSKNQNVGGIYEIDLSNIEVNPYQPRETFDKEALEELSESIKKLGIIQPIAVRKINDERYQIISGERRVRAARIAGLKVVPAYIREANDQGMLEMTLVENIQREDLNPIEVALSFNSLIEEYGHTQEQLSERVGKKRSTIANYIRLLKLPAEIQLGLRNKTISMGHAKAIINIEDAETQLMIYHQILKYDFTVRKVEEIVRQLEEENESDVKKTRKKRFAMPEEYKQLKNHLQKHFNSEVKFYRNDKGKGRIVIPFNTDEELEQIIAVLDKIQ